jgi:ATP-binding cassette subfamily B protein
MPVFEADRIVVAYGSDDDQHRALDEISFRIHFGETVGLAGPSGSGKSTLVKVLMRLMQTTAGNTALGGVPIQNVSREAIGRYIGYVGQNPFVFAGTIAENIVYGCDNVDSDRVEAAAEMAGIHDEIMALPGRYNFVLRERGQNLSGGQRQRIALARIFLKNPPILVFDEGTSALDTINEHKVQLAIEAIKVDRTLILIAHRLSTLRHADRILVFDRGRIVEEGTLDTLANRGGVFTQLLRMAGD